MLVLTHVLVRLNTKATIDDLKTFDTVILACGITPRTPEIPGIDHRSVVSYLQVLRDKVAVGKRVAIIGAEGIGVDVAHYLSSPPQADFYTEWGIDRTLDTRGGVLPLAAGAPTGAVHQHEIVLLQRKAGKLGEHLGKTTGWIHRAQLLRHGVSFIDDAGLHIIHEGQERCIAADTIIVCAEQDSRREFYAPLQANWCAVHLIGGADVAAELDARRAIDQATRLALTL